MASASVWFENEQNLTNLGPDMRLAVGTDNGVTIWCRVWYVAYKGRLSNLDNSILKKSNDFTETSDIVLESVEDVHFDSSGTKLLVAQYGGQVSLLNLMKPIN